MKNVVLVTVAIACMSSFGFSDGDMKAMEAVSPVEELSPFYVGLGLSNVSTSRSSESVGFFNDNQEETGDILLMAGYDFNQYIAVEGRYMTSVFGENRLTRESWGIYVKPQYPASEAFTLYALLGYGGLKAEGKGDHIYSPNDIDDTSFQWGIGASYDLDEHFSIFFDYVNLAKNMDADMLFALPFTKVDSDALSVGLTYNF